VNGAEDGIVQLGIGGLFLQAQEVLSKPVKNLVGLHKETLQDFCHLVAEIQRGTARYFVVFVVSAHW